ncbi:hypothetical protein ACIBLA_28935 [Streptomyces sp. NPDC050433]
MPAATVFPLCGKELEARRYALLPVGLSSSSSARFSSAPSSARPCQWKL